VEPCQVAVSDVATVLQLRKLQKLHLHARTKKQPPWDWGPRGLCSRGGREESAAQRSQLLPVGERWSHLETTTRPTDNTEPLWALRHKLRPLAVDQRTRTCGLYTVRGQDAQVVIGESPDGERFAYFGRVKQCGRHWICPRCAQRTAAKRHDDLDRLMRGDVHGRWQMVTLTMQHHTGEALRALMDRLTGAWRRTRSHRRVRCIMQHRVTASVRAIEVTYGQNGWHPHIHLLWRTDEWTEHDRRELETIWCESAGALPGVGVRWSTPIETWTKERAHYLARLGCEVAGLGKQAHAGHLSPFELAERAASCRSAVSDFRWLALWREFQIGTKRRRRLEFDERAVLLMAPPIEHDGARRTVDCYAELYQGAMRVDWWLALSVLETARYAHGSLDDAARAVEEQLRVVADALRTHAGSSARGPPARAALAAPSNVGVA
jgi:hypothetical protein